MIIEVSRSYGTDLGFLNESASAENKNAKRYIWIGQYNQGS